MSNHKYVCPKDGKFFDTVKVGVYVEEMMPRPGAPDGWAPYKLLVADLHRCPACGFELVAGFGSGPVAEHYQPGYADAVNRARPLAQIRDC